MGRQSWGRGSALAERGAAAASPEMRGGEARVVVCGSAHPEALRAGNFFRAPRGSNQPAGKELAAEKRSWLDTPHTAGVGPGGGGPSGWYPKPAKNAA